MSTDHSFLMKLYKTMQKHSENKHCTVSTDHNLLMELCKTIQNNTTYSLHIDTIHSISHWRYEQKVRHGHTLKIINRHTHLMHQIDALLYIISVALCSILSLYFSLCILCIIFTRSAKFDIPSNTKSVIFTCFIIFKLFNPFSTNKPK